MTPFAAYTLFNSLVPGASGTYDLGTSAMPWRSLYVTNSSIYMGTDVLTISANTLMIGSASGGSITPVGGTGSTPVVTTPVTLTYAASTSTDVSLGTTFRLNLSGNTVLKNPDNPTDGKSAIWWIRQHPVSGQNTVTLGSQFRIPTSATTPLAWSVSANYMDMLAAKYDVTTTKWYVISFIPGY